MCILTTQSVTPGHKARPHIDMDRYLADEERLPGSDLVLWVNVGVQHHTHSEDIPVTTTNGNTVRSALYHNGCSCYLWLWGVCVDGCHAAND
jgi:hypothetical protein